MLRVRRERRPFRTYHWIITSVYAIHTSLPLFFLTSIERCYAAITTTGLLGNNPYLPMSGMGMDMGSLGGLFGGGGIGGVMNPMMVGGTGMINPMISGMGMTNPMMMDPNFNAALNPMMMGGMGMMNPMMGGMGMMNPMMGGMGMMNPMMGGMGMGGMMPPFIDAGPMPGIGYNPMMMPSMYPGMGGCIDTSPSCSIMQISATGCNTARVSQMCPISCGNCQAGVQGMMNPMAGGMGGMMNPMMGMMNPMMGGMMGGQYAMLDSMDGRNICPMGMTPDGYCGFPKFFCFNSQERCIGRTCCNMLGSMMGVGTPNMMSGMGPLGVSPSTMGGMFGK